MKANPSNLVRPNPILKSKSSTITNSQQGTNYPVRIHFTRCLPKIRTLTTRSIWLTLNVIRFWRLLSPILPKIWPESSDSTCLNQDNSSISSIQMAVSRKTGKFASTILKMICWHNRNRLTTKNVISLLSVTLRRSTTGCMSGIMSKLTSNRPTWMPTFGEKSFMRSRNMSKNFIFMFKPIIKSNFFEENGFQFK